LGLGQSEIWAANLDPNVSIIEALGPAQTLDEHVREMLAFYTRRIEADPQDAYAYSGRAQYYDCLHERQKATADMRCWSAILSPGLSSQDAQLDTPRPRRFAAPNEAAGVRRVINMPFNCQFVFSAERPVNEIPVLNIAFGQKGRCHMKSFRIPLLSMSLFGLGLLWDLDVQPAYADFTFGNPVNLRSVVPAIDPVHESPTCLSYDGLEMYITSDRTGGQGGFDVWVLKRDSIDAEWGPLENLGPAVNTAANDFNVSISVDGLTLYFDSFATNRPGAQGQSDIYMTTRATRNDPWGQPVNLGPKVNTARNERCPSLSSDGLELYFESNRAGGYGGVDICVSRRPTPSDPWGNAENLGPLVNSPAHDSGPHLSPDGLLLVFSDDFDLPPRPGGYGGCDLWMVRRATLSSPWQAPVNLGPVINTSEQDLFGVVSPDGSLYFVTFDADFNIENWRAPIVPVVDFNADGKVDIADVFIMLEHWLTDYPLCDIGPYAWGDGIVDAQDLIVLAEHIANTPADVNDVNNIQ
jgi:hypothetical protein